MLKQVSMCHNVSCYTGCCITFQTLHLFCYVQMPSLGAWGSYCKHHCLQLGWTFCAETHKINLPQDQEGYNGFEYTDEKLSTRRIHWCRIKFYIFYYWREFLPRTVGCNSPKALIWWSEVLLKCLSLAAIFLGSPAAVFLLKNRSRLSKFVSIEIN